MSDEKFPLPGSSYKELSKIIAAYATISGPTSPSPVGKIAVVHETIVSRNNKFLAAVGLIDGGRNKACTELGAKLGRAIQHDQTDAINDAWLTVVSNTDFLQKILSAVRIRKGMEESALASHIAFTAGSAKNAGARAGAGAVIDILKLSGSITADGSTLIATAAGEVATHAEQSPRSDLVWTPVYSDKKFGATLLRGDSSPSASEPDAVHGVAAPGASLTITLKISCGVGDLEGLGLKLRKIKEEFDGVGAAGLEVNVEPPGQQREEAGPDAPDGVSASDSAEENEDETGR